MRTLLTTSLSTVYRDMRMIPEAEERWHCLPAPARLLGPGAAVRTW